MLMLSVFVQNIVDMIVDYALWVAVLKREFSKIIEVETFTGLYTKWDSFTPRKYKINLIRSLTYRYYRVCSSGSLLQSEQKQTTSA